MRIGHGYDVHAFASQRKLILGGVNVPYELGLAGHSDADVLAHAAIDAVLGAARIEGALDIGQLFPDTADEWEGADSLVLAAKSAALVREHGFELVDLDCTVAAQAPKLASRLPEMRSRMAEAFGIPAEHLGIKATTTERLGFVGRKEGIEAWAVALLEER